MEVSNLNCKLDNFSDVENTNLLKVEILVQHDGENKNGSKFSLDAIKKAESTIKNIPILAYIKRSEDGEADFDEHNMITKIVEDGNGFKLITQYLEVPIGVIPSDTEVSYEEINNRTYLKATGYIWKRYSNEGYYIVENSDEKSVSMEIEIFKGEKDKEDGLYEVQDYQFLGVTCLGDDVEPGMYDTTITKYSLSKKYKKHLEDIYKEIYILNDGKEKNFMEKELKKVDLIVPKIEDENLGFSADKINASINSMLEDRKVEAENYWGEKYTTREFYLHTVLSEEKIAVVEDSINHYNYYGIPYKVNGDDVELNFDSKVAYIQEWRVKKEDEVIDVFKKEDLLKEVILEKFGKKELEIEDLKSKIIKLEEFKEVKEQEDLTMNVNKVIEEFATLGKSELDIVKNKVLNKEIGLEDFRKELFCLVGMKALSDKETFSANKVVSEVKIMDSHIQSETKDVYGGLITKYKK